MLRTIRISIGFFFAVSMGTVVALSGAQVPKTWDPAPEINGKPWINSPPLTLTDLRGKVVLVEFWTYG